MESKKLKIVIVGHSGVGKTSIINRYVFENSDLTSIEPTLGAVYHEKVHQLKNGERVTFEIWDTAGQERYRSIAKIYYKDAKVVLAVYDVTSSSSFEEMKHWIDEVRNNSSKSVRIILVGNKIDLVDAESPSKADYVNFDEAKNYANSLRSALKLTSAYDNKGIDELFDLVGQKATEAVVETKKET